MELLQFIPNEYHEKIISIDTVNHNIVNYVTTGCLASQILYKIGFEIKHIGFSKPASRVVDMGLSQFHIPGASLEVAVLKESGVWN